MREEFITNMCVQDSYVISYVITSLLCDYCDSPYVLCIVGMCGKPKFGSDSVFKNRTVQKFDIRSDDFPTETACNPQCKLNVPKITLFAFSVQIKNVFKHN